MEYQTIQIGSRAQWRNWLKTNHSTSSGVWFTFYKQHTGKKSISYNEAVEEALCYGWIDSTVKKLDDERYIQKFTPRTNNAKWSAVNIKRMKKLIKEKRMTRYGIVKISTGLLNADESELPSRGAVKLPANLTAALKQNKAAYSNFNSLAPSYQRNYIRWIISAKKDETRMKRLNEAITLLAENKKLGLK